MFLRKKLLYWKNIMCFGCLSQENLQYERHLHAKTFVMCVCCLLHTVLVIINISQTFKSPDH